MIHVFVDFEMCMVPKKAAPEPHMHFEIIQFGAVKLDADLNIVDEFSRFVKPQYGALTPEMTELTGITREMLVDQGGFIKVFSEFLKWLGTEEYTVYSWSGNDLLQLKNETRIKKFPVKNVKIFDNWIDFQKIFTNAVRLPHSPSLGHALELMQLEFVGSKHFADVDAYNTARLFKYCSRLREFSEFSVFGSQSSETDSQNQTQENSSLGDSMSAESLKRMLGFN